MANSANQLNGILPIDNDISDYSKAIFLLVFTTYDFAICNFGSNLNISFFQAKGLF